jgi:hypothetical protein
MLSVSVQGRASTTVGVDAAQGRASTTEGVDAAQGRASTTVGVDAAQGRASTTEDVDAAQGRASTTEDVDADRVTWALRGRESSAWELLPSARACSRVSSGAISPVPSRPRPCSHALGLLRPARSLGLCLPLPGFAFERLRAAPLPIESRAVILPAARVLEALLPNTGGADACGTWS